MSGKITSVLRAEAASVPVGAVVPHRKTGGVSMTEPERIEAQIQRIREVYPNERSKCAWCGVKQPKHNFDCPAVDVHFLLAQLSALTEAMTACQQERDHWKRIAEDWRAATVEEAAKGNALKALIAEAQSVRTATG